MARSKIEVLEEDRPAGGEQVERIVALGEAFLDPPILVRMLGDDSRG